MLRIVWTSWHKSSGNGFNTVWNELGSRFQDYGVQLVDLWEPDWDLPCSLDIRRRF